MKVLIRKLRNREAINQFNPATKVFTKIQLNRKAGFICWQRFVSLDRRNWIEQQSYLSIKGVIQLIQQK